MSLVVGTQRPPHIIRIDQRPAVHRQVGHGATHLFQPLACVQHRMMLNRRGDEVIARLHQAKQRQVVALGAAAGEDDLRRTAVQQLGNLLARVLHRRARLLSLLMNGRRVAELLEEVGTHGLKHFGKKRSGGVVVEVDPMHFWLYSNGLIRFGAEKRRFGEEAAAPWLSPIALSELAMEIVHFPSASDFRKWLTLNHDKFRELWVGFYKKKSGNAGISYQEAVDEALCFGWIDGLKKAVDDVSYTHRFTPRKPNSFWSAVNIKRVGELKAVWTHDGARTEGVCRA